MLQHSKIPFSLRGPRGQRKYPSASERKRFLTAAGKAPPHVRLFCQLMCLSGARISEVLALSPAAVDLESSVAVFATLKRRKPGVLREVPLPRALVTELETTFELRKRQRDPADCSRRLWPWSRTTAWRRVKEVMAEANVHGLCAMPRGLRHGFGVTAFQVNVPPNLVQRWMGHASFRSTMIYADVTGKEERAFAARMWRG